MAEHVPRYRTADDIQRARRREYARELSNTGLHHARDILPYLDFARAQDDTWRAAIDERALRQRTSARGLAMIIEIVRSWAEPVISALAQGRKTLTVGEWVTWTQADRNLYGKISRAPRHANDTVGVHMYDLDSSKRLTCAQHSRLYSPAEAQSRPSSAPWSGWTNQTRSDTAPTEWIRRPSTNT